MKQEWHRTAVDAEFKSPPAGRPSYLDPGYDIAAVYQSSHWARLHDCSVRGVPVAQLARGMLDARGISYAPCLFPDGRVMLVNEGNIKVRKVKNGYAT